MCGRVTATMRFLVFGTSPLGALLGGALGGWLGVRPALWVMLGAVALSGTLLLTPRPPRRQGPARGPAAAAAARSAHRPLPGATRYLAARMRPCGH